MIKAIPMEDWLRGCIYHDGRHGYVTLPIDKVHQIANYIQRTRQSGMDGLIDLCGYGEHKADRKAEPITHDDYIESENDYLEARCLNCNNAKACKEKHWDGCVYEPKYEGNCSEKPNNCEHITEDGVTCAKYPACDDCLDNPLNKVKGSKRLLKGKDEPQTNADQHVQRVEYVENDERSRCWKCKHFERMHETPISSDGKYYTYVVCTAKECNYEPKDKPQTCSVNGRPYDCGNCEYHKCTADEPQTEDEILREQCRAFMGIVEQTERSEE